MSIIKRILKYNLCLGCGFCEGVGKEFGCTMGISKSGFYIPLNYNNAKLNHEISNICPAINVIAPKCKNVWGNTEGVYEGWSTDPDIRYKGSSGGAISSICVYLLESKTVSAVLHVGTDGQGFLQNQLLISRTREDVMKRTSSRYAPSLIFNDFINVIDSIDGSIAFVGKPCDIAGLKNFINKYPKFQSRFRLTIALFCAGMPSYNATIKLIKQSQIEAEPISVKYRGEGWPGKFVVQFSNSRKYELSYNESWGGELHKDLNFRCKICPDGCGLLADIAIGDAWETKDGVPDFRENDGRSIVLTRTTTGTTVLIDTMKNNYITIKPSSLSALNSMQPYQYERQFFVGYRLIVIKLLIYNMLNFKGIPFYHLMRRYPIRKGISHAMGTAKRFIAHLIEKNEIDKK